MVNHARLGHHDYVCPECGRRVGGCRCMEPGKTQLKASAPCEECWSKRVKPVPPPAAPEEAGTRAERIEVAARVVVKGGYGASYSHIKAIAALERALEEKP